jgi:hypothetical protein
VQWETRQGHGPGGAAAQSGAGLHKSGVKLDEPVRKDLGFAPPRSVRLLSVPDPRASNGGPRGVGDEIADLKAANVALWQAIAELRHLVGAVQEPEPAVSAPEPPEPALSPQQRIDQAMTANLAALNRGAIKSFRR